MTSGQILLLVAAWVVVSVPCALLVARFIGFGEEIEITGGNPAFEQAVRKAA